MNWVLRPPDGEALHFCANRENAECVVAVGVEIQSFHPPQGSILITDRAVASMLPSHFSAVPMLALSVDERSKSFSTVRKLFSFLMKQEADKGTTLIGIGGGIVCDLVGFVASTYMRGIPFGFFPTTLLAQVDAAIGGKNGINVAGYKNIVGTIRQPLFCYIDLAFIDTLPERERINGFSEIIKYALIGNEGLFKALATWDFSRKQLLEIVLESVRTKLELVAKDVTEQHERIKLNFGHTFGHAFERISDYSLPHGAAVALGMLAEAKISVQLLGLPVAAYTRIEALIDSACGTKAALETSGLLDRQHVGRLFSAIKRDKKKRGTKITMPLLSAIGHSEVVELEVAEIRRMVELW